MDLTYMHLWAAGYDLPPETVAVIKPRDSGMTTSGIVAVVPRRGKKAARAKRQKGQKP